MSPRIVTAQLILHSESVGDGTPDSPKRSRMCVTLPNGQLLCWYDPHTGTSYVASLGIKELNDE